MQVGEVALTATFKANHPNHFTDQQLLGFFERRLKGIFAKAEQSGLLDENEKKFLSNAG
ncbi:hypothetical protein [Methylocucumis oryzae]|uniref:hypothetical protein n=1 Tax=Methylocucumis oryzae TaxID=1632867 RepID=UPI0012FEB2C7|nr:hypothetical protein [Methylocucumis oryzae]